MVRLLSDANFNNEIVRGLRLRRADFDAIRGQDVLPEGVADPQILDWVGANDRIVLTHDLATMADFAYARIAAGLPMPGVFVANDRLPVSRVIDELLMINECSEQAEWADRVLYLPL